MVDYLPLNLVDLIVEVDCFIIYRKDDTIYNNHDTADSNDSWSMYHDGDINDNNLMPIDRVYIKRRFASNWVSFSYFRFALPGY